MAINFFRFNVCMWIALVIAVCSVFLTFILFIPNTILVALKYRGGLLPSLRSEGFKIYRGNITSITYLIPGEFWSIQRLTALQMDISTDPLFFLLVIEVVFWSAIGMAITIFTVFFIIFLFFTWSVSCGCATYCFPHGMFPSHNFSSRICRLHVL